MLTYNQIKAINDAMTFLITSGDLLHLYGLGCIETEFQVHYEIMVAEGVPDSIVSHFADIVHLQFAIR